MKFVVLTITASLIVQAASLAAVQDSANPGASLLGQGHTSQPPDAPSMNSSADAVPDATVKLRGGAVAAGVGYVWGHGTMTYQGGDHKFRIRGVSVADIGGAKIVASGQVMHLDKLSDFAGTYVAWSAGATLAGGGSAAYMKNEHGVVIKLLSTTEGLRFNLAGNGVKVTLES